ncbi:MAG TPA: 2-succinyl-5-enolpyruvyl-6-hydroxy-3-cyclohexene-1-carboxylic-acid synthase [Microbacterium sp.]|nr:2-succinyl-5-enolpyruvyl-6-hydroxy-3-cyclohexene-1-carboxylic-acid synthase [Microbacterium sp.]
MTASSDAACDVLDRLVARGVRHVIVSPGSRSQALALAAAELERQGRIRLHVRLDERVAGFTALGIGRQSRLPAAVICTSGSAVANLHPAVLEAHHAGVPMILLTADRPPELRGVGANQTTHQPGFFGQAAAFAADAPTPDGTATGYAELADRAFDAARAGSVAHLNMPFREPLAGELPAWFVRGGSAPVTSEPREAETTFLARGPRTVVVAGADAGEDAVRIADRGGWPLLAEVVSGSRHGATAARGYRAGLSRDDLGGRIERVIVVGHPTLGREVTRLLRRDDVEIVALQASDEALNLNHRTRAARGLDVETGGPIDTEWLDAWRGLSAPGGTDPHRSALVDAVWRATSADDRIVFGSSRLVRVADDTLWGRACVHANRGLAGIDGTLATAMGVQLAAEEGTTRVILGDLAFLYDAGALLRSGSEGRPNVQIVVGNDGGGTIFDGLEVARIASAEAMERVQLTPQHADIAGLAAAYGWDYVRAESDAELDAALAGGPAIIEVPLPR